MNTQTTHQRVCSAKVNVADAARKQSERSFQNTHTICPVWNGTDTTGRKVSRNSFSAEAAGCNHSQMRIALENFHRPNFHSDIIPQNYHHSGNFGHDMNNHITCNNH